MDYVQQRSNPTRHIIGLTIVILLHLALIWALMNGLGSAVIDVIRAPISTKIIKQPPPPHAIQTVTHAPPPPGPPQVYRPAPAAPPGPPDHSAGVRPINNATPQYPEDMQDEGREGRVSMSCDISTTGNTSNCHVLSSQGGPSFVRSAFEFVRRARYQPAVRNGVTVPDPNHVLNITFSLGGGGDD